VACVLHVLEIFTGYERTGGECCDDRKGREGDRIERLESWRNGKEIDMFIFTGAFGSLDGHELDELDDDYDDNGYSWNSSEY